MAFWAEAGATGAGCLCEGMNENDDLIQELQDWLSSLPPRRLEEDAECRRLLESVYVLNEPSSGQNRVEIQRHMKSWGVRSTSGSRTVSQRRAALEAHLVQVGRSLRRGPPAVRSAQPCPEGSSGSVATSAAQLCPEGEPAASSGFLAASAEQPRPEGEIQASDVQPEACWSQAGATGAGCLREGIDGDGDMRQELQDWLSSLPRRRLEEDAECRRLEESVSVLVGPSSRHTREEICRLMTSWGVQTTRATRTLPQRREALWAHLVQVGRSLRRRPPAVRVAQPRPEGSSGSLAASAAQPRPIDEPAASSGSLAASAAQPRPQGEPVASSGCLAASSAQPRPEGSSGSLAASAGQPRPEGDLLACLTRQQLWRQKLGLVLPTWEGTICAFAGIPYGYHANQLSLAECSAVHLRRVVMHLSILAREKELAAVARPGRHKEADEQMKSVASVISDALAATAPVPRCSPGGGILLGEEAVAALEAQRLKIKELRAAEGSGEPEEQHADALD